MAPFDIAAWGGSQFILFYLAAGFAFGFILESSGFGDARKIAGQFYFTENTVLKVMFTAIAVACLLVHWATALGLLYLDDLWVNPTYLWPGIVGGLIMGVGFVVGGYCPGTSLVSLATLKLDGLFFVLGVMFGIFLFGETVGSFYDFYTSSAMGRFTLDQWLGISTGTAVLLVMVLAIVFFWVFERIHGLLHAGRSEA